MTATWLTGRLVSLTTSKALSRIQRIRSVILHIEDKVREIRMCVEIEGVAVFFIRPFFGIPPFGDMLIIFGDILISIRRII